MAWAGLAKDAAQNYLRDFMWLTWQDGIFLQAFSGMETSDPNPSTPS
jgi:hypothetical protein